MSGRKNRLVLRSKL